MHTNHYGDIMTTKTRPRFNPEFKVECAQLVLDQRHSIQIVFNIFHTMWHDHSYTISPCRLKH